eukprot:6430791-Alexandrium_andersonii.AAC.1
MGIGGEAVSKLAEVLRPARPMCSSQGPASECPPEPVLKRKEPVAMNVPVALKVPVRRYRPVAAKE